MLLSLNLGRVYEADGHLDEAMQAYVASAEADPKNIDTRLALGQGYLAQEQYAQAETALNAVLAGNPDRAEGLYRSGRSVFPSG